MAPRRIEEMAACRHPPWRFFHVPNDTNTNIWHIGADTPTMHATGASPATVGEAVSRPTWSLVPLRWGGRPPPRD